MNRPKPPTVPHHNPSLQPRLYAAIEAENFNTWELLGFATDPKKALLCGAAIGYQLATEDYKAKLDNLCTKSR